MHIEVKLRQGRVEEEEDGWNAYLSSLLCHRGDLVGVFCTEHRRQNRSQYTLKQARSDTVSITNLYYLHYKWDVRQGIFSKMYHRHSKQLRKE